MSVFMPLAQNHKSVFYRWMTHNPRGLSAKDVHMARFCDEKADYLGQLNQE